MMCGQNREKLDCRGVPLRQLQQEAQDKRGQAEEMKRDIADMVDMYHLGGGEWWGVACLFLFCPTECVLNLSTGTPTIYWQLIHLF